MSNILNEARFGLYELFANIIPGTIFLMFLVYIGVQINLLTYNNIINIINYNYTLIIIMFTILSFVVGQVLQAWGSLFCYMIYKLQYGGFPSVNILDENKSSFPKHFIKLIKEDVINNLNINDDDYNSQNIFDLCYTYVIQNDISVRVINFLNMFEFSKNMMGTTFIMIIISVFMMKNNFQFYGLLSVIFSIVTILFYYNFIRYGNSFSNEVLRSYFINMNKG